MRRLPLPLPASIFPSGAYIACSPCTAPPPGVRFHLAQWIAQLQLKNSVSEAQVSCWSCWCCTVDGSLTLLDPTTSV